MIQIRHLYQNSYPLLHSNNYQPLFQLETPTLFAPALIDIKGDQLYMAVYFLYLVNREMSSMLLFTRNQNNTAMIMNNSAMIMNNTALIMNNTAMIIDYE